MSEETRSAMTAAFEAPSGDDGVVLINCAVFDAARSVPLSDAGIWVRGDRIAAVGPVDDVRSRAGRTTLVDLDGATVLPGLVNMHAHFGDDMVAPPKDAAECAVAAASDAQRTLHAGITTVRLVAQAFGVDFALRRAITRRALAGPRIFTAGRAIACTGGHCHSSPITTESDGTAEFRKAVRREVSAGADLIKLMLSGGIAGENEGVDTPQITGDELSAVLEIAHAWDRKVTAHAGPGDIIADAVKRGLDGVEHGYQLNDAAIRAMAERQVLLVPTLAVTRCRELFERVGAPAWMIERSMEAGGAHVDGVAAAVAAGVPVAVGTDMLPGEPYEGTFAHAREMEYLVELAGLTPAQAIAATTITPARWLGIDGELGTVDEGKFADLVACDGDPSTDVSVVRSLRFVMKSGAIVRHDRRSPIA